MDDRKDGEVPATGEDEAPTGGDERTEERLQADIDVEEDTLRMLDPGAPSG